MMKKAAQQWFSDNNLYKINVDDYFIQYPYLLKDTWVYVEDDGVIVRNRGDSRIINTIQYGDPELFDKIRRLM